MNDLKHTIDELNPWFHNLHLPDGTQTAPGHFLGDFPQFKWDKLKNAIPENLKGWKVLDVGCNAGFYTFELAKRGAHVTGIDVDPHYLEQARWAAGQFHLEEQTAFRQMQVYDLGRNNEEYDLVWFMGVLYHLRYPLLALDILAQLTRKLLVVQTLTMPGMAVEQVKDDYSINDRKVMLQPGWPKMAFIEKKWAGDPTNWWAPNHACIGAMIRSCGMKVMRHPLEETYICAPDHSNPSSCNTWNASEYLSAIGKDWIEEAERKTG